MTKIIKQTQKFANGTEIIQFHAPFQLYSTIEELMKDMYRQITIHRINSGKSYVLLHQHGNPYLAILIHGL